jgi:hypothetical protein
VRRDVKRMIAVVRMTVLGERVWLVGSWWFGIKDGLELADLTERTCPRLIQCGTASTSALCKFLLW